MKQDIQTTIEKWVSKEIQQLASYHVADTTGLLKLDAMENSYLLPEALRQQWLEQIRATAINRYPCVHANELKQAIRCQFSLGDSQLLLGNGSDELIQMIVMLVGGRGRTFVFPEPSFSMYRHICLATGTNYRTVPLQSDFSLDDEGFLDAIKKHDPACVFLAYPNNPTGNCFNASAIRKILDAATGLVVVDEAYFTFCRETFFSELTYYPNLLILRTLSKNGFAGLRFGFMIGHEQWLSQIEKIRLPYNINSLTQKSMIFFLDNSEVFEQQGLQIIENRNMLIQKLQKFSGLKTYDSHANFVLVRSDPQYGNLQEQFVKHGILIKSFHQPGTMLENCYRITIGNEAECEKILQAMHKLSCHR